jgi:tetratricopeptide (TPR) repeat protein
LIDVLRILKWLMELGRREVFRADLLKLTDISNIRALVADGMISKVLLAALFYSSFCGAQTPSLSFPVPGTAADESQTSQRSRKELDRLKQALTLDPDNPEKLMMVGLAEDQLGMFVEANRHMRAGLKKLPSCAQCWVNFGINDMHLNQLALAEHALIRAIQLDYQSVTAYFDLGQVYAAEGKISKAIVSLEKARKLAPKDFGIASALAIVYSQDKNAEACEKLLREIENLSDSDPESQASLVILLSRLGKPEEAMRKLETLRSTAPNSVEVKYSEAVFDYQFGLFQKAQGALERLPETIQRRPDILELHGMVAAGLGDYREAISLLEKAANVEPTEENLFKCAYVLYITTQYQVAQQRFSELIHIAPGSFRAQVMLGVVDEALGQYNAAGEAYQHAISLEPTSPLGPLFLGKLQAVEGAFPESVASFKKTIKLAPSLAEAHYYCGLALEQSGDSAKAVSCLRTAIRLKPSFSLAYLELGKALLRIGRIEEAGDVLQKARSLDPNLASVHYALIGYYRKVGNLDKAAIETQTFAALRKGSDRAEEVELQRSLLDSYYADPNGRGGIVVSHLKSERQ